MLRFKIQQLNTCKYIKYSDYKNIDISYYSHYYKEARYKNIFNELKPIYRIVYLENGNIFFNGKLK